MTPNRELVQAAVIEYEESLIDAERDSRRLTDQERFDRLVQAITALLDAKDAELAETRREIELGYPGRPAEEVEAVRKLVDAAESWSQGGVSSAAVHEAVDGLPPRWEDWLSGLAYDPLGLAAQAAVLREALRETLPECQFSGVMKCQEDTEMPRSEWCPYCSAAEALSSPSPAVEAVRDAMTYGIRMRLADEALAQGTIDKAKEDLLDARSERSYQAMGLTLGRIIHRFPALAAGLEKR